MQNHLSIADFLYIFPGLSVEFNFKWGDYKDRLLLRQVEFDVSRDLYLRITFSDIYP